MQGLRLEISMPFAQVSVLCTNRGRRMCIFRNFSTLGRARLCVPSSLRYASYALLRGICDAI